MLEFSMLAILGGLALLVTLGLAGADFLISNLTSDELTKMGVERKP